MRRLWSSVLITVNCSNPGVTLDRITLPSLCCYIVVTLLVVVVQITGVDPDSVYAVRVRSRLRDGQLGNLSGVVFAGTVNRLAGRGPGPDVGQAGRASGTTDHLHPGDSVHDFIARVQHNRTMPTTVYLQWKPPRTPGVIRYMVDKSR